MLVTTPELKYNLSEECKAFPVIVVAAGSSSRMNGVNKQLISIGAVPVVIRTLLRFEKSPYISRIILVTREEDILFLQRLTSEYDISKLSDIAAGGCDRHSSVMNGISRLRADENKVMIHDGARPLVSDFVIGNVAEALENNDAVICGIKINDTVKRVKDGIVTDTVEREGLYAVQTPQGVNVEVYKKACQALGNASDFTDDAGIMEAAGIAVKMVEGERKNIKITTAEDVPLAELYLKEEML